MAPGPKTGPALFLGLELATDQLSASIVDEKLGVCGSRMRRNFHYSRRSYTTPVDMWVRLLHSIRDSHFTLNFL
ncbi:hypothetical protein BD769DRAFT_1457139 [Suillus cothurnatus]|nr:hypothetical protein BD769DRAFT_1457139 [Suillus cothurnatus]